MNKNTAKVLFVIVGTVANIVIIFAIGACLCFLAFYALKLINPEIFLYVAPFILLISVFLGTKLYQKITKYFVKKYELDKILSDSNNE